MGEATYYMKVRNCDEKTYEEIKALFKEGAKASDWWQEHRDVGQRNPAEFWNMFVKKFQRVAEYADFHKMLKKDGNNEVAGKLDFGTVEDVEENMGFDGGTLSYYALVWHFADWQLFADFIQHKYPGTKVTWVSDEYLDPFETI